MTIDVAWRYTAATGVMPESVMSETGNPLGLGAKEYTPAYFKKWAKSDDTDDYNLCIACSALRLLLLLEAAAEQKRLRAVDFAIQLKLDELQSEFHLVETVSRIARYLTGESLTSIDGFDQLVIHRTGAYEVHALMNRMTAALLKAGKLFDEKRDIAQSKMDRKSPDFEDPESDLTGGDIVAATCSGFDEAAILKSATFLMILRRQRAIEQLLRRRKRKSDSADG